MWNRPRIGMVGPHRPMMGGPRFPPQRPPFFNQNMGQRMPAMRPPPQRMPPRLMPPQNQYQQRNRFHHPNQNQNQFRQQQPQQSEQFQGKEEMMPQDPNEAAKITSLQMQAQQWTQNKQQIEQQQEMQQKMEYAKQCTPADLDAVLQEEVEFEKQYSDWKKQFLEWQEQNKNHPNQEQYRQYAQTWKDYETQMEEKKAELTARRSKLQEAMKLKNQLMAQTPRPMAPPMMSQRPPMMAPRPGMGPVPPMVSQGGFGMRPPPPMHMNPANRQFGPGQFNMSTFTPPPALPPIPAHLQGNFPGVSSYPPKQGQPQNNQNLPLSFNAPQPVGETNETLVEEKIEEETAEEAEPKEEEDAPPGMEALSDDLPPGVEPEPKEGDTETGSAKTEEGEEEDGLAEAIMAAMEKGEDDDAPPGTEEPPEKRARLEADAWTPDVANQVKRDEERIITEAMKKNVQDNLKEQERKDTKLETALTRRDERLAFEKAAETMRLIQEQQERIQQIKKLQQLQKQAEKEEEEERIKEEEEKQRQEKRKVEEAKKLAEKKSSQLQQQIEKALDRAAGKSTDDQDDGKKDDKKIQIKVNLLKDAEKPEDKEDKDKDNKDRENKDEKDVVERKREEQRRPVRSYRRRSLERSRSRSPRGRRRSRSRSRGRRSRSRERRSRSRGRRSRSRSRSRGRRSRSPRRKRRSRSKERNVDAFGRSLDIRRPYDEEKDKKDREERERRERERERERRAHSPSRGDSRSRVDELRKEGRRGSVDSTSSSRPNGKTSLVPYDDEDEDRARADPSTSRYRDRDPYSRDSRDPLRDRDRDPMRERDPYSRDSLRDPVRDDPYKRDPVRDDPYKRDPVRDRDPYARDQYRDPARDPMRSSLRDRYSRDPYARAPVKEDPLRSRDPYGDRQPERRSTDVYYERLRALAPRTPLYDRPPVDDVTRRLLYGRGPVYEAYPEQKYNREHSVFGDDEDDQAVFDYMHGEGKLAEDPYSDPGAPRYLESKLIRRGSTEVPDDRSRDSPLTARLTKSRDSPSLTGRPFASYDYEPPSRDLEREPLSRDTRDIRELSRDLLRDTPRDPPRDPLRDSLYSREATSSRDPLSTRDSLTSRDSLYSRDPIASRDALSSRDSLTSSRDSLTSSRDPLGDYPFSRGPSLLSREFLSKPPLDYKSTSSSRDYASTSRDASRDDSSREPFSRLVDKYDNSSRSPLPVGPPHPVGPPAPLGHPSGPPAPQGVPPPPPPEEKSEVIGIEELLSRPDKERRTAKIVIIVRGLPGSGKTYVSKLIREREVSGGGAPPRMLCLDDYFMVETEKIERDPETGRMTLSKVMEYEYESFMENSYRVSMLKSFKKTVDDGYFPFIIVDAVNGKIKQFEEFWSYATSKGFQVYVAELEAEATVCVKRNIHSRTQKEINNLVKDWETLPPMFARVDVRSLLQDAAITDVEMTDYTEEPAEDSPGDEDEPEESDKKSKWELDTSESKLDRLDGLSKRRHLTEQEKFDEYLQLPDDYQLRGNSLQPGRKRVRWADIEERADQERQRNLGFVVGHTDWNKMLDDNYAHRALNRTKYF